MERCEGTPHLPQSLRRCDHQEARSGIVAAYLVRLLQPSLLRQRQIEAEEACVALRLVRKTVGDQLPSAIALGSAGL